MTETAPAQLGGAPKRKVKPQLTLIPEEGRAINYRFEVTLVGEGSKDFAKKVVESETAEAFHPKGWNAEQAKPVEPSELGSVGGPGEVSAVHSNAGPQLVLFCPLGDGVTKKSLARLRFVCIEDFADSVPTHKEPTVAANSAVVFLFWRVGKNGGIKERLMDYTRVLAEIKHQPQNCRPFCVLHAYEADDKQEKELKEFLSKPLADEVNFETFDDDGEDTVIDVFGNLCEKLIEYAKTIHMAPVSEMKLRELSSRGESRCCSIG